MSSPTSPCFLVLSSKLVRVQRFSFYDGVGAVDPLLLDDIGTLQGKPSEAEH